MSKANYVLIACKYNEDFVWGKYVFNEVREPVAEFTELSWLQAYVDGVTLERFPNGNRRFRKDSLLGSASYYDVEEKPRALPVNPVVPTCPPKVEYIVVLSPDKYSRRETKVLCKTKESAEKEIQLIGCGRIEERLV